MAGKKKKKAIKDKAAHSTERVIARNRRAKREYELVEECTAGIALVGSEVKSIRNAKVTLEEAYARVIAGEVWLLDLDVAEYPQANLMNHEPRRRRKLLLKKKEIQKLSDAQQRGGLTIVPMQLRLERGFIKVDLAVGKGRKLHDKREKLKERESQREMDRAVARSR